jgi:hypothetical protein
MEIEYMENKDHLLNFLDKFLVNHVKMNDKT